MLAAISSLKYIYFAYFSRPACDRAVYRAIRRQRVRRILAIGLGSGERAVRMIRTAQRYHAAAEVRLTALDLFEARSASDPAGLSLKQAHRLLTATGARVQLVPGDPFTALAHCANALQNTDLVILAAGLAPDSLARAWFYLPRMLQAGSLVFEESFDVATGMPVLTVLDRATIDARAAAPVRRHAA
jgi:hypothetical protein